MKFRIFACALSAAVALTAGTASANVRLRLANSLSDDHPTSQALKSFADEVAERTDGEVTIRLFLNGVLGSEGETLEQLKNGVNAMRMPVDDLLKHRPHQVEGQTSSGRLGAGASARRARTRSARDSSRD